MVEEDESLTTEELFFEYWFWNFFSIIIFISLSILIIGFYLSAASEIKVDEFLLMNYISVGVGLIFIYLFILYHRYQCLLYTI